MPCSRNDVFVCLGTLQNGVKYHRDLTIHGVSINQTNQHDQVKKLFHEKLTVQYFLPALSA